MSCFSGARAADHVCRGNEKCQQGNPSCQAVYGPGTLSNVFGWDYFDAIAFLINFNNGYPVTIPDMVAAFQFSWSSNPSSVATVVCQNSTKNHGDIHSTSDEPIICSDATFTLSRDFTLPMINQTAASIYDRIIPAPGGDCKLVDSASNAQSFPIYNLTITGLPVSIACNLTANAADDTAIPNSLTLAANGYGNTSNIYISPANESTSGTAGAYVSPPPAVPFAGGFNSTNSVCISSPTSATFCLPNGTYDQPTGLMGYTITSANAVTIPADCSLTLQQAQKPREAKLDPNIFTTSQDSSSSSFAAAIKDLSGGANPSNPPQLSISIPSTVVEPVAACFFTKTQYLGDVFCMGPGGGNFTGAQLNATFSVGVYGGASLWIYAEGYGDSGGQMLAGSVPDLSTEPYGTASSFAGRVVAAWITPG